MVPVVHCIVAAQLPPAPLLPAAAHHSSSHHAHCSRLLLAYSASPPHPSHPAACCLSGPCVQQAVRQYAGGVPQRGLLREAEPHFRGHLRCGVQVREHARYGFCSACTAASPLAAGQHRAGQVSCIARLKAGSPPTHSAPSIWMLHLKTCPPLPPFAAVLFCLHGTGRETERRARFVR